MKQLVFLIISILQKYAAETAQTGDDKLLSESLAMLLAGGTPVVLFTKQDVDGLKVSKTEGWGR